jgi:hypothetical protein
MSQLYQFLLTYMPLHDKLPLVWHFDNSINTSNNVERLLVGEQLRIGVNCDHLEDPWTAEGMTSFIRTLVAHPAFHCYQAYFFPETRTGWAEMSITVDSPQTIRYKFQLYFLGMRAVGAAPFIHLFDGFGRNTNIRKSHFRQIRTDTPYTLQRPRKIIKNAFEENIMPQPHQPLHPISNQNPNQNP